jgi:hypothetical protein
MKKIHGKAQRFLLSVKILYLLNEILSSCCLQDKYTKIYSMSKEVAVTLLICYTNSISG